MSEPSSASSSFDLNSKVAIVTGGSRGIGLATATALSRAGAKVVIASRKPEPLEQAAAHIREQTGGEVLAVPAHTGDDEAVQRVVAKTVEAFGGVDVLVNNAATNPHFGPIMSSQDSHWDKTYDVNVKGYFRMVKACVPEMQTRGGGRIINIASVAGRRVQPGMGVYCVSKAAVCMLTQVLAVELADAKINVNALTPGFVKTKFSSAIWGNEAIGKAVLKSIPQHRMAQPEEIANLIQFLASDASSFVTGSIIDIDGGQLAASGIPVG
ncbi:short chain dehydrogenase [Plesiocystis pacifica SIR-1]|uniref:Short chain dehydrogenase n=1 Tax=Plesiocystis pacifica SIR-1 TaxID=391625 RepID=A6G1V5_9BACT|nr:SDR family oxidoreductase [Plesiocystis pacifica]EDM80145.1 short chain dehydrogenase [Plesiocystis pacifica SIR-1]